MGDQGKFAHNRGISFALGYGELAAKLLYCFKKTWIQKLLWCRLGFLLKWYIESFLMDWAKDKKDNKN